MAEAIDSELISFKTKVSPSLSSMESTFTTLVSKIDELITINKSTQTSISSVYSSENKDAILDKFTQINDIYNKVDISLENDLKKIIADSSALVEKITKLETLKKEIEEQESKIKSAGSAKSYNSDMSNKKEVDSYNYARRKKIEEANSVLSVKKPEFTILHEEAKNDLIKLKSADSTLSFVTEFKPVDLSLLSQYFTGSSFEKYTYKASNGETIEYYLYVPEYSTEVSNLPAHLYLHGSGGFSNGVLYGALPYYLAKKDFQSNSIIICPQGEGSNWRDTKYQEALMELTNNVVSTYNVDTNRISLSGHSMGAIGGYELISRNPDYFSAFIPIAGNNDWMDKSDAGYDALGNVKIWAFHGTEDTAVEYSDSVKVLNELKERGYNNMTLETLEGEDHNVQANVYYESFEYDGESYIPFEWALLQTKGN